MDVSVIMPSYGTGERVARRAIESVVSQRYADWELVYVDDNPAWSAARAASERLAGEYGSDGRVRFFFHEENLGANRARNTAISESRGEWLAFLDVDDYWDPGYLEQAMGRAGEGDVALVSTPIRVFDGRGFRAVPPAGIEGDIFETELFGDVLSPSSGIVVRRDALERAGGFDERLPARQDYDMWLRVCRENRVGMCSSPLVTVDRDGHESISSGYERHLRGTEMVIEKIRRDGGIDEGLRERAVRSNRLHLARFLALRGEGRLALKQIKMAGPPTPVSLLLLSLAAPLAVRARGIYHILAYR